MACRVHCRVQGCKPGSHWASRYAHQGRFEPSEPAAIRHPRAGTGCPDQAGVKQRSDLKQNACCPGSDCAVCLLCRASLAVLCCSGWRPPHKEGSTGWCWVLFVLSVCVRERGRLSLCAACVTYRRKTAGVNPAVNPSGALNSAEKGTSMRTAHRHRVQRLRLDETGSSSARGWGPGEDSNPTIFVSCSQACSTDNAAA